MKSIIKFATAFLVVIVLTAPAAHAKTKKVSVIRINPVTDGGKYITLHQSSTLPQWGFNLGGTIDFAFEPLEITNDTGVRRRGVVDDLLVANFHGAVGWTNWWSSGINVPLVLWETFYNPDVAAPAKETFMGRLGDTRFEMKFRLLDIKNYNIGLALVPFIYFPTGKSSSFLGSGMWSPGATLVFDADIKNRVFLTFNLGYREFQKTRYDNTLLATGQPANRNAFIDDTLSLGGGINVRINDTWAVVGELWSDSVISNMFKNQLQNPSEFLVAGRFTPQSVAKGLGVTVGGGRGITTGVGSPNWRIMLGVNYRRAYQPTPAPVEVEMVEEKIVITQKIHFEFGRANIRPVSYPILGDVAELIKLNPQIGRVRVEGHTDWVGSDAANQKLSDRRARSVRDYLIQKGVEPDRLDAVGFGESRPIADNHTERGRALNRRTEFIVVR